MEQTNKFEEETSITPNQLAAARVLAAQGLNPNIVAESLNLCPWELIGRHAPELDESAATAAKNAIGAALYELAAAKTNSAATIFWVKSYGHPPTTPQPVKAEKPEKEKPYVWNPNDPNDRVKFSVYNNDGEPNHDY
jgi:hypothetical protein